MKKINLLDIFIFLFMALFIYAAATKLLEYDTFRAQIGKSPLIMNYADLLAWLVPASEIATTIFLFIPHFRLIGLYFFFSIMFGFTAYIFFVLNFSPYVPCSCGGILNSMGWTEHLLFNLLFTLMAFIGIVLQARTLRKQIQVSIV